MGLASIIRLRYSTFFNILIIGNIIYFIGVLAKKLGLRHRYTKAQKLKIAELDCWIVSPGGVATTSLIDYLNMYRRANHPNDGDGLKHKFLPPDDIPVPPVIYIDGNYDKAAKSLNRRKLYFSQMVKLDSLLGVILPYQIVGSSLFRRQALRQKENWSAVPKLLVIDYGEVFESAEIIADFLGIKEDRFFQEFPVRQRRTNES